jgi:hypothetical protein
MVGLMVHRATAITAAVITIIMPAVRGKAAIAAPTIAVIINEAMPIKRLTATVICQLVLNGRMGNTDRTL